MPAASLTDDQIIELVEQLPADRKRKVMGLLKSGWKDWWERGHERVLSYRRSGVLGTEMFLILGDPNAKRIADKAAIKLIFAL